MTQQVGATFLQSSSSTLDWVQGKSGVAPILWNTFENTFYSLPGFLALGANLKTAFLGSVVNSVVGRLAIWMYVKANIDKLSEQSDKAKAGLPSEEAAVRWVQGQGNVAELVGTVVGRSVFQMPGFLATGYGLTRGFAGSMINSAVIEGSVLSKVTERMEGQGDKIINGRFFLPPKNRRVRSANRQT